VTSRGCTAGHGYGQPMPITNKWLVFAHCWGSHIFSSMPNKHGIKKKPKSSLEDPALLYISQV